MADFRTSSSVATVGEKTMKRGNWGNKFEFILTCIGTAVGLGNVWRFPYLLFKSGGGAFLIPFALLLITVGIPLIYLELNLGQFASLGALTMWRLSPLFKGLGFSMIFTELMMVFYYNVIICWCLYYFFASFTSVLPWVGCDNPWNTFRCMTTEQFTNISGSNTTHIEHNGINISRTELKTASEEYYYRKVLQMSEDGLDNTGTIVWQLALCLFLCWFIVFVVLIKGISSLGKVVYFTSTFPYVLLTVMLVRGVLLDGSIEGILFYINPDFSALADPKVWSDAAIQVFYSLNTCSGSLIAMSSYNKFKNNTLRDAILLPLVNLFTSIYAGFAIFSVLGYMAKLKGVQVVDVAADGPGLVFVVYPEGLATMPAAPVWSVLFFFMMLMLGLSSMFSMTECFFVSFMDEFPHFLRKNYLRTVMWRASGIFVFFLISLPMVTNAGFYLFSLVDMYTGSFPLLVIGAVEIFTLMFVYGVRNFEADVAMMLGKPPNVVFRFCLCVLTPIVMLMSIIATGLSYGPPTLFGQAYPEWAEIIGWLIIIFCVIHIPLVSIIVLCKNGLWKIISDSSKPLPNWGPALQENWTGRYANKRPSDDYLTEKTDQIDLKNSTSVNSLEKGELRKNSLPTETIVSGLEFSIEKEDQISSIKL